MFIQTIVDTLEDEWLKRDDLTMTITNCAVAAYRMVCGKIPFEELQRTAPAIPTTIGGREYSLASLDPPLAGICSIRIDYNSTQSRRLSKDDKRNYEAIAIRPNGRPARYARWAKSIIIDPPPDSTAYTLNVDYWSGAKIETGVVGSTVLVCPDEWVELLNWETYYRVLTVLGRHNEALMLVQPGMMPRQAAPKKVYMNDIGIIPRLWNDLLLTIRMREYVDDDFGMKPILKP